VLVGQLTADSRIVVTVPCRWQYAANPLIPTSYNARMRYRLRTLLIVLALGPPALAGALIAGRAIQLQRRAVNYQLRAAAHDKEAEKVAGKLCPPEDWAGTNTPLYMREYNYHRKLADEYRNAVKEPWVVVREVPQPKAVPTKVKSNTTGGPLWGAFDVSADSTP
jgi:hypothetical protein